VAVRGVDACRAIGDQPHGKLGQSAIGNPSIGNRQSAIDNRQSTVLWPHSSTTSSSAGIRTSPSGRPICGAIFDAARPADELAKIEQKASDPDFWKDQAVAQKLLQRRRRLEDDVAMSESLKRRAEDLAVLVEWAQAGESVADDLARGLDELAVEVESGETKKMLGGEHDRKNAIITIHPGAGGTESQDWAEMLLRMYVRWTERRGFKREVMDMQPGDEAGIKSATLTIYGDFAYGMLLAEAGVHRLVRISPFDQAARRHTSFASLYVWPELPDDFDIEIDEKDLRVDTFRSSGAGGQHVNVTDSAIRITHVPSGIVVSCQNERSQHKNRAQAMKVLKSRLFDMRMKEQEAKLAQLGGEKRDIAFGSQIRNYVMQPYQLVKDLRTKEQTGDINRVLDGDIDQFIKAYLMKKAAGTLAMVPDEDVD
jgi:peptide chain release factor 2